MAKRHHESPREDFVVPKKRKSKTSPVDMKQQVLKRLSSLATLLVSQKTRDEKGLRTEAFYVAQSMGIDPQELKHAVPFAMILAQQISVHDEIVEALELREIIVSRGGDVAVIPLMPHRENVELQDAVFCLVVTYHNKIIQATVWSGNDVRAIVDGLVPHEDQHRIPFHPSDDNASMVTLDAQPPSPQSRPSCPQYNP